MNYEVSETSRQIIKAPGAIRKVSVAVLVDQEKIVAADGSVTFQPRTDAELATLKELVASAVGFDEARGDVLTLKSLPFQQQAAEGTLVEAGMFGALGDLDLMSIIQLAVSRPGGADPRAVRDPPDPDLGHSQHGATGGALFPTGPAGRQRDGRVMR